METEEAIKISLACQVAMKAVEILRDTEHHTFFGLRLSAGQQYWLKEHIREIKKRLDKTYDIIYDNLEMFDAEDDQAITDLVCNIEKALNQRPTPVLVHPEISDILNRHLGEK